LYDSAVQNNPYSLDEIRNSTDLQTAIDASDIIIKDANDVVYTTMVAITSAVGAGGWSPTALSLGDGISNGATLSLSSGAGYYANFDAASNDEYLFNVELPRNGLHYDGSNIVIDIDWMKFGASGGTVIWEIDYAFCEDGDDAYSKQDGTLSETVNVGSLSNQVLTTTTFNAISGVAGARTLQLTVRRRSSGGGSDTYTGVAEMYGFNIT